VEEVEDGSSQKVPDEILHTQDHEAAIASVDIGQEIPRLFPQVLGQKRVEYKTEHQDDPQKHHSEAQRQLVSQVEAEGSGEMAQTNIAEVADIAFD
jgi:hypothetical protein